MSDDLVDIFKFANLKESDSGITDENEINPDTETTIDYHDIMTEEYELNDTRVAMIGNVDSGKSTLIGVLTNATLDDGRGGKQNIKDATHHLWTRPSLTRTSFAVSGARALILKHRHEQENGRTSAVTVEIMGYKVIIMNADI